MMPDTDTTLDGSTERQLVAMLSRQPSPGMRRGVHAEIERRRAAIPRIPVVARRGKDCWILEFACAWCRDRRGKPGRHSHGGGPLDGPPSGGHRVGHCRGADAPAGGYELVVVGIEP